MAPNSSLLLCFVILLVSMIITTNGLQCHICGQFNDGVGSITPCLNYTKENAHLHLKECPRKTDKFCVVSIWSQSRTFNFSAPRNQHFFNYNFFLHVSSKNCFLPFFLWGEKSEMNEKMFMEMKWRRKKFWKGLFYLGPCYFSPTFDGQTLCNQQMDKNSPNALFWSELFIKNFWRHRRIKLFLIRFHLYRKFLLSHCALSLEVK